MGVDYTEYVSPGVYVGGHVRILPTIVPYDFFFALNLILSSIKIDGSYFLSVSYLPKYFCLLLFLSSLCLFVLNVSFIDTVLLVF